MIKKTEFVTTLFDGQANPNKVTVAFTMGVNALMKGHTATIILMVDAVYLGQPGSLDGIDIGSPFEPASTLLARYLELGGTVAVCGACIQHNGLTADQMDVRFPIITAPDVVDLLMGATGSLQIT